MQNLLDFGLHHWPLVAMAIGFLSLVIILEVRNAGFLVPQLSTQKAVAMMNRNQVLVLDVRNHADYEKGHIAEAYHLTAKEITQATELPDSIMKHQPNPIIVVCDSGMTSMKVVNQLQKQGLDSYVLSGGIQAWRKNALPIVSG